MRGLGATSRARFVSFVVAGLVSLTGARGSRARSSRRHLKVLAAIVVFAVARSSSAITEELFFVDPLTFGDAVRLLEDAQREPGKGYVLYAMAALEILRARELESVADRDERKEMLERAARDLALAAKRGGKLEDYHYLMFVWKIESDGDLEGAFLELEKTTAVGPISDRTLEQLAIVYLAKKRYEDCVELLAERVESSANPQFSHLQAMAYLYLEDPKRAAKAARKAVDLGGGTQARLALASAQSLSGDLAGAEATLRKVLADDPGNRTALFGLSDVLRKQGRGQEAKETAAELGKRYPEDEKVQEYLERLRKGEEE